MAVLSEPTLKLSRNLKIAASISLLFALFSPHFCGTISVFGNPLPEALARFALAAVVGYHVAFLLWHSRVDYLIGKAKPSSAEAYAANELDALYTKALDAKLAPDTNINTLVNLANEDAETTKHKVARDMIDRRNRLEDAKTADLQEWKMIIRGHIAFPCLIGAVSLVLLFWTPAAAEIGSWLVDASELKCESTTPLVTGS